MKGLWFRNKIVQVEEEVFDVHPNLKWVDVPDECRPGWDYDGTTATPPVVVVEERSTNDELYEQVMRARRS